MSRKLKCFPINVNSLISLAKRHYLQHFINQKKPDILLLNETKLNDKHVINFGHYTFVKQSCYARRNDNGRPKNYSTAILVKNTIKFSQIHLSRNDNLDFTAVKIFLANNNRNLA